MPEALYHFHDVHGGTRPARTCGALMHMQNLPIVVTAEWLGHAGPTFTMRTYVHSQDDALKRAAETWQRVVTPS